MKTIYGILILLALFNKVSAQKIVGTYKQSALVTPDAYRDSEHDVLITQDLKSSKKINNQSCY